MKGIRLLIGLTLIVCVTACHNSSKTLIDGGPCTYNTRIIQAEILSVDSLNAVYYDVKFTAYGVERPEADTFYYSRLYQRNIDSSIVHQKHLHAGQKVPFRVDNIQSGTCNPLVTQLLLDSL
jgi:hypothetical protein